MESHQKPLTNPGTHVALLYSDNVHIGSNLDFDHDCDMPRKSLLVKF